ncbi:hypothetical protein VTO42DRAFT_3012 [Malbranchea cinnamomea]
MAFSQRRPPPPVGPGDRRGPPPQGNRYPNQAQGGYYDQSYDHYAYDTYDNYQYDSGGGYDDAYWNGQQNGGVHEGNYGPPQSRFEDNNYGPQSGAHRAPALRPPPPRQAPARPSDWPLKSSQPLPNRSWDSPFPEFPQKPRRSSVDQDISRGLGALDISSGPGPVRPPEMRPHTSNSNRPSPRHQPTAPPIPEAGRRTADPFRSRPPPVPEDDPPVFQPPKRSATMPVTTTTPGPSVIAATESPARPKYPGQPIWQDPIPSPGPRPSPSHSRPGTSTGPNPESSSSTPKATPVSTDDKSVKREESDNDAAADFLDDYFDSTDPSEPDMPNFDAMDNSRPGNSHDDQLIPTEKSKDSPSSQPESKGGYTAYRPPGGITPSSSHQETRTWSDPYNNAEFQYNRPLRSPTHGSPEAGYYGHPPGDNLRRQGSRIMPPGPGPHEGYGGQGRYPSRAPPNSYGGPVYGNAGQRPYPPINPGYHNHRNMQMGRIGNPGPDPALANTPANPDALPHHPAPYRPGLEQGSSKPPPMRQYNNPSMAPMQSQDGSLQFQGKDHRASTVVTHEELQRLQQAVREKPSDHATQLTLAKKLVEASVHLIDGNGGADTRTRNKNRERYILDAHKIVKKLVNAGYAPAMFYLADCYGQGLLGLEPDPKEAFSLYQSAAKLGHPESAYRLAVCCELGFEGGGGTRRDPMKAVQWYRRAAALGDTPAMYKMGMILLKGLLGQPRNPREALPWLKRAAERADEENPHALHELALLYENPQGIDAVIKDEAYALELLHQAAELGYKFSQFRLGAAYEYGLLGCPVDARQSIYWYTRAAAQGEHQSELALSGWYLTGAEGILQQSDTEAYLWARKAAIAGLAKAEYAMGYFSEVGIGVPANLDDAKRWYWKASSQNYLKARERLEELRRGGAKMQKTRVSRSAVNKQSEGDCIVM